MPYFANHNINIKAMKICLQIEANMWHFELNDTVTLNWNALLWMEQQGECRLSGTSKLCMRARACVCVCVCQTDAYI
jgi:hypothetical protein